MSGKYRTVTKPKPPHILLRLLDTILEDKVVLAQVLVVENYQNIYLLIRVKLDVR